MGCLFTVRVHDGNEPAYHSGAHASPGYGHVPPPHGPPPHHGPPHGPHHW